MRSRMHNRRSDIVILAFSLILAAGMWLVHILSQTYYAYMPFNITAVTEIEGFAPQSSSTQTLFLGGKARGFFLLNYSLSGKRPKDIEVELSPSSFQRQSDSSNIFSVSSSKISDRISESVNSFFEATFIPQVGLEFEFEPQTHKKVPVSSRINISCREQYMVVSELKFTPDSVTVYGNESDLDKITSINTRNISLSSLDRSSSGVISLEKMRKLRVVPESVSYSLSVGRYFEYTYDADLVTVNVPPGKELIVLPSKIRVSCRLPFGVETDSFVEDSPVYVDYNDVIASRSSMVAPKIGNDDYQVYSFICNPRFVECKISEAFR